MGDAKAMTSAMVDAELDWLRKQISPADPAAYPASSRAYYVVRLLATLDAERAAHAETRRRLAQALIDRCLGCPMVDGRCPQCGNETTP